jgi:hypothetical protein
MGAIFYENKKINKTELLTWNKYNCIFNYDLYNYNIDSKSYTETTSNYTNTLYSSANICEGKPTVIFDNGFEQYGYRPGGSNTYIEPSKYNWNSSDWNYIVPIVNGSTYLYCPSGFCTDDNNAYIIPKDTGNTVIYSLNTSITYSKGSTTNTSTAYAYPILYDRIDQYTLIPKDGIYYNSSKNKKYWYALAEMEKGDYIETVSSKSGGLPEEYATYTTYNSKKTTILDGSEDKGYYVLEFGFGITFQYYYYELVE